MWLENKLKKKLSTFPVLAEMQIKATIKDHHIFIRRHKINDCSKYRQVLAATSMPHTVVRNEMWDNCFGETFAHFIDLFIYDLFIVLLSIYAK